jgi:Spy/CpxP family protein refolding chaperone
VIESIGAIPTGQLFLERREHMNQFLGKCLLVACVAAIVAVAADPAWAQRGRGMGRMRMFSPAFVASLDEVQTDLKLTDEQKTEIATINDDTRGKMRDLFSDGGPPDMEAFQKLNQEAAAEVEKLLEPTQVQRLQEITLQVNGASALNDAALREKLHFTEEQTAKFEEARDANRDAMQEAMDGMEDLSREERRAKRDELRKGADERLLAVLTPEQKTEFEAMQGAPLEIDLSQLRGRFGGGRGRDN